VDRLHIPGAVPADIAERLSDQPANDVAFDEFDDALMHDLIGDAELAKPVQQLLQDLWQIEVAQSSFGADPAAVVALLLPHLHDLRKAVQGAL
jgi:hypothetical protein